MPKELYCSTKHSARARGLPFRVTQHELWRIFEQQESRCALTGWPLSFQPAEGHTRTASIDRIDSSKGYVSGTVQWVHRDVNRLKRNFAPDRFFAICAAVSAWHSKKR
jgi:hypothetical protein